MHIELYGRILAMLPFDCAFAFTVSVLANIYYGINTFVGQIKKWLKDDGTFIVGYQEGDLVPKTEDATTTKLAEALRAHNMPYEATDITAESYEVLKKKYDCAMELKEAFEKENNKQWFDMLIGQTAYANVSYELFRSKMARYMYIIQK